jgi:hypothetical protein
MINEPIYRGLLQSDLDFAGFNPVNLTGWPPTGGGSSGLDANTVTAASIGLIGDGATDNTTAFQTWLNSVAAAKVNTTLLVPDGVYIFSGPLQDTSYCNAQIILPSVSITDHGYSLTIKGYHPISYTPWPIVTLPGPRGPIFRSTLASGSGTQPSFIGGKGPPGTVGTAGLDLSYLDICFENMIFQTVQNPQITCVNLSHFSVVELRGDILIMAGTGVGENDSVQPTTSTSYGLILPPNNYGILQQADTLNVWNFYTGVRMGELSHIINMTCALCVYALEFGAAYHMILIDRIVDWHCKNGINMTGACPFQVRQYDVERAPASLWYTRVNDVNDPSNYATADITWRTVVAFVGGTSDFTINGGANVQARQIGTVQGSDLRWVALAGGGKLQARNTSTGVWADVDQWTNP